jgi:hypothetical protein
VLGVGTGTVLGVGTGTALGVGTGTVLGVGGGADPHPTRTAARKASGAAA